MKILDVVVLLIASVIGATGLALWLSPHLPSPWTETIAPTARYLFLLGLSLSLLSAADFIGSANWRRNLMIILGLLGTISVLILAWPRALGIVEAMVPVVTRSPTQAQRADPDSYDRQVYEDHLRRLDNRSRLIVIVASDFADSYVADADPMLAEDLKRVASSIRSEVRRSAAENYDHPNANARIKVQMERLFRFVMWRRPEHRGADEAIMTGPVLAGIGVVLIIWWLSMAVALITLRRGLSRTIPKTL